MLSILRYVRIIRTDDEINLRVGKGQVNHVTSTDHHLVQTSIRCYFRLFFRISSLENPHDMDMVLWHSRP